MDSALESDVPVRFVFVLVGPSQSDMNYSEMGRAMGALMADWVRNQQQQSQERSSFWITLLNPTCLPQVFCLEAFLAQTDTDVTNAIADFMDCSIVIPPTDIQDPEMLQPVINYQRRILRDRLRPADARLAYGSRVKGQQDTRGR